MTSALRTALSGAVDKPFALFGHSMGALLAFELARRWSRQDAIAPVLLMVAGCRAPSVPTRKAPIFALSDDDLIAELRSLNGTPDDVLVDRDAIRLFLPALRADFEIADRYVYRCDTPLTCRIVAYGGAEDHETPPADLDAWARETSAGAAVRLYVGEHFFIRDAAAALLRDITADLGAQLLGAWGPEPVR